MSTLANMKVNLEASHLSIGTDVQKTIEDPKGVSFWFNHFHTFVRDEGEIREFYSL